MSRFHFTPSAYSYPNVGGFGPMSSIVANGMQNFNEAPPLAFAERDLASALLSSDIMDSEKDIFPFKEVLAQEEEIINPLVGATSAYPTYKRQKIEENSSPSTSSPSSGSSPMSSPPTYVTTAPMPTFNPFLPTSVPSFTVGKLNTEKVHEARNQEKNDKQKEASRKYRAKKKEMMYQMSKKIDELQKGADALAQQNKQLVDTLHKLQEENKSLKAKHKQEAAEIQRERLRLLTELEVKMKQGASDKEIQDIVVSVEDLCLKIIAIGECHLQMLMTPNIASHLANSGFFTSKEVEQKVDPQSVAAFMRRIEKLVPDLTEVQKKANELVLQEYNQELQEILAERELINDELVAIFARDQNEPNYVVQVASSLEMVRNNMRKECELWETKSMKMVGNLTIRQRGKEVPGCFFKNDAAKLWIDIEYQHRSVTQLKRVWEAIQAK